MRWLLITALLLAGGCTSVATMPAEPFELSGCNLKSHLQCIHRTGTETIADGRNHLWTRHWFRTSYIGRACVKEYGPVFGYTYEALFAIPHYLFVGLGNLFATLTVPGAGAAGEQAEND